MEKSEELQPDRAGQVEQVQPADRERRDAEENDVEAARGRHLEGDENEADGQPVPPFHAVMGIV